MIADSLPSLGASPLAMMSRTWLVVMIPPMIVVPPVIIASNQCPVPLCSSKVGLAIALGTPY